MEPSPGQRRLADALRGLRLRSGLSGGALGQALGWTQTRVSRTETAQRRTNAAEVSRWAEATSANDDERAELERLMNDATRELRSWWDVHSQGMTQRQQEIASLEVRSERILNFQPVIPGLLQTADYALRAVTLADVSGQRDIPGAVRVRLRRQEILYDRTREFQYVITESALLWELGGDADSRRAQADRLISLDSLPNVSIAVLPFTARSPILPVHGFTLYDIPGEPLALVETLTDELLFGGAREVTAYREAFAALRAVSVSGDSAHAMIVEGLSRS